MDSGRVGMSQEWSRVVSAEVKKEYKTLQGVQTHCSQLTSQKLKVILSLFELDINASQACIDTSLVKFSKQDLKIWKFDTV